MSGCRWPATRRSRSVSSPAPASTPSAAAASRSRRSAIDHFMVQLVKSATPSKPAGESRAGVRYVDGNSRRRRGGRQSSWPMPAHRCMTATRSRPCSPMTSIDRGCVNGFEYLGMVDPPSAAVHRLLDHPPGARLGQLHQAGDHAAAERRHSGDLGRRSRNSARRPPNLKRRSPRPSRTASPASRASGTSSSSITDGLSVTTIAVRAGDQHRPRAQRRQGRRDARARQPAAERQRAADPARRRDRPADRHLRRDLARQDAGTALVVRRRRRQARAAGRARRRPGRAHRRRRARNPRLARSRPAAGRRG